MHAQSSAVLLFACAIACARSSSPFSERNATQASSASVDAGVPSVMTITDARVLSCGFGGAGPATLAPATNQWVALVAEVSAASDVRGVTIDAIELRDDAGHIAARAIAPTIVVVPSTHAPTDFSTTGATPFDGRIPAGAHIRLLVNGALDVRTEAMKPRSPRHVGFTLIDDHANRTAVDGVAVGPWPTA